MGIGQFGWENGRSVFRIIERDEQKEVNQPSLLPLPPLPPTTPDQLVGRIESDSKLVERLLAPGWTDDDEMKWIQTGDGSLFMEYLLMSRYKRIECSIPMPACKPPPPPAPPPLITVREGQIPPRPPPPPEPSPGRLMSESGGERRLPLPTLHWHPGKD